MVAQVSVCPVDYAHGSVKLPLVGAGGDRIEHIGQKTLGYATRDGANVDVAFEAAQVRRPLPSVDSLFEKAQVEVFTNWLHHPEVCIARLSSGEEAEHEATERTLLAATRSRH